MEKKKKKPLEKIGRKKNPVVMTVLLPHFAQDTVQEWTCQATNDLDSSPGLAPKMALFILLPNLEKKKLKRVQVSQ